MIVKGEFELQDLAANHFNLALGYKRKFETEMANANGLKEIVVNIQNFMIVNFMWHECHYRFYILDKTANELLSLRETEQAVNWRLNWTLR